MGWLMLLLLMGLMVGGYFFCRRLKEIEADIRREIEEKERESAVPEAPPQAEEAETGGNQEEPVTHLPRPESHSVQPVAESPPSAEPGIAERIIEAVKGQPGVLQKDLYAQFPGIKCKTLQEALLRLDRQGRLERRKEKGTYRLFLPASKG